MKFSFVGLEKIKKSFPSFYFVSLLNLYIYVKSAFYLVYQAFTNYFYIKHRLSRNKDPITIRRIFEVTH